MVTNCLLSPAEFDLWRYPCGAYLREGVRAPSDSIPNRPRSVDFLIIIDCMLLFALHEYSSTCTQFLVFLVFLYENISVMMDGSSLQPCVKHEIKKKNTESKCLSLISFNMIDPKINIPQPIYWKSSTIPPPLKERSFGVKVGTVASSSPQSEQFVSDYSPWCDFIWF